MIEQCVDAGIIGIMEWIRVFFYTCNADNSREKLDMVF